jgi:AraC-like DNA-binding protein
MQEHPIESIRRHDDGTDMWEIKTVRAGSALAGKVERYGAYVERTASFSSRRELASTSGVLIYVLGDPLSITDAMGREIVIGPGEAFVGGIAEATSISRALGPQRGIHVYMPFDSLATLCGAPIAEIANRCVSLADLIGAGARDLGNALGEARCDDTRFTLLDDFFARRLRDDRDVDRPIRWVIEQLRRIDAPAIERLADHIGWSRKHLACRFSAVTGVTPQTFRRLARFERLCTEMARSPSDGLAELAVDAGYFDQPHLTREIVAFSGMTPGALRARLIPSAGGVRHD